jgi:transposase-like protein
MNKSNKFSPEVHERAVRMVQEQRGEYPSLWAAVESIAPKIGCVPQTLLEWVHRAEVDGGHREGVTTADAQRVKDTRARGQGIAPGQRDPEAGQRVFRPGGARLADDN